MVEIAPSTVETTLKRFTDNNDSLVGAKVKEDIDSSTFVNTDGDTDVITEDEFEASVETETVLEKPEKKLDPGHVDAVWNAAVVETIQEDIETTPITEEDIDDFIADKKPQAQDQQVGITVDPDERIAKLDSARGKIQEQISKLEDGGIDKEEEALVSRLKEERDSADGKRQVLLSNGANIILNGSSVIEINPEGPDFDAKLDGNFSSVYDSRKEAWEGFKAQYKTSTGSDFELKDNQTLVAYRRQDGLYWRVIQSQILTNQIDSDDTDSSTADSDEPQEQRVTSISDEISFTLEKAKQYDKGVTMQIAGKNPQNPDTGSWDPAEYQALPGKAGAQKAEIGFTMFGAAKDAKNAEAKSDISSGAPRYVLNILDIQNWIQGIIDQEDKVEDKDKDGIPDYIDIDVEDI